MKNRISGLNAPVKAAVPVAVVLALFFTYAKYSPDIASYLVGSKVGAESKLGAWGDSFGAFNALISSLAFVGIVLTLLLQRTGLGDQADDQHRQRFESTFFELLKLQREARRDLLFYNTDEFNAAWHARSFQTFSWATTGRVPPDGPTDPVAAAVLEVHFQLVRRGRIGTENVFHVVSAYMRHVHSVSEGTFAPYFRLIYSLLDRVRSDPILTDDEKVHYGNLVRSQLSSGEVLLLGINSLSPISADMKSLVHEFRMLKYLPKSSMRSLLERFHDSVAFLGRDEKPPVNRLRPSAFADVKYRKLIAALHAERKFQRLSRRKLNGRLGLSQDFVAAYEDGKITLSIPQFVEVSKALGRHPALFLRQ